MAKTWKTKYNPLRDRDHLDELLTECMDKDLNEWEEEFVEDMTNRINDKKFFEITPGQYKKIQEIVDKDDVRVW